MNQRNPILWITEKNPFVITAICLKQAQYIEHTGISSVLIHYFSESEILLNISSIDQRYDNNKCCILILNNLYYIHTYSLTIFDCWFAIAHGGDVYGYKRKPSAPLPLRVAICSQMPLCTNNNIRDFVLHSLNKVSFYYLK